MKPEFDIVFLVRKCLRNAYGPVADYGEIQALLAGPDTGVLSHFRENIFVFAAPMMDVLNAEYPDDQSVPRGITGFKNHVGKIVHGWMETRDDRLDNWAREARARAVAKRSN